MKYDERYIVLIGVTNGRRVARRHPLVVPTGIATGNYEELSDRALRDHMKDLIHEHERRMQRVQCPVVPPYDPWATQIRETIDLAEAMEEAT